jgi:hypothetical protein
MGRNLLIISIIFICSCSPQKRIARILKHHPELVKSDTVFRPDTVITKLVQKDTSFHFFQPDTVFIKEGKLTYKYFLRHDSTVYLDGKCDPDTIIREIPFIVNNTTITPLKPFEERVKLWIFDNMLLIILVLYVLYRIFGTTIKTFLKL